MANINSFSCVIIGEGALTFHCLNFLLENNFDILAVVSNNALIKNWAATKSIECYDNPDKLLSINKKFDYLFSIFNIEFSSNIISEKVLNLPQKMAINYHDGPLPGYAGFHVTSHALFNQERDYGVSWHVMTPLIDSGPILVKKIFALEKIETALSLNLKCDTQGLQAFSELIMQINDNDLKPIPQNLLLRHYFDYYGGCTNYGFISWSFQSAMQIFCLCKGLEYGKHPHPLGKPKFILLNEIYILKECALTEEYVSEPPGTIIEITDDAIKVATLTNCILIKKITTLCGKSITLQDFSKQTTIKPGDSIAELNNEELLYCKQVYETNILYREFWYEKVNQCMEAQQSSAKLIDITVSKIKKREPSLGNVFFSLEPWKKLVDLFEHASMLSVLQTLLSLLIARLSFANTLVSLVSNETLSQQSKKTKGWLTQNRPVLTQIDLQKSFYLNLKNVTECLACLDSKASYFSDTFDSVELLQEESQIVLMESDCLEHPTDIYNKIIFILGDAKGEMLFDENSFSKSFILKIIQQLESLVQQLLIKQNQNIPVYLLHCIDAAEYNKILNDFNPPTLDTENHSFLNFFAQQVQRVPDSIAVADQEKCLTYNELDKITNSLAHYLCTVLPHQDRFVGVFMDRTVELIVAIIATVKAHATYVPLDSTLPLSRVLYILNDTKATTIITKNTLINKIKSLSSHTLVAVDKFMANRTDLNTFESTTEPNEIAYVIYTSGSTGEPKGILIKHASLGNLLVSLNKRTPINDKDTYLSITNIMFDASIIDLFYPLSQGAKLILIPKEHAFNAEKLKLYLSEIKPTIMQATPTIWKMLQTAGWEGDMGLTLLCGGEALELDIAYFLARRCAAVWNEYGPAETTVNTTMKLISIEDTEVTIGKPLENVLCYIVDPLLNPIPIGSVGELLIGGKGLALEYLNRKDLNTEKFIPNEISPERSAKLYRTGDLCSFYENGEIKYIGRIDQQIKIRGMRIEPGEIEATIKQFALVLDAVIFVDKHQRLERLIAFVTFKQKDADTLSIIQELYVFLRNTLPNHLIPAEIIPLVQIPLNNSGKIDKRQLELLLCDNIKKLDETDELVSEITTIESTLKGILSAVLYIKENEIKNDRSFFDIGLDSLNLVEFHQQLNKKFHLNTPTTVCFDYPTVNEMVDYIKQQNNAKSGLDTNEMAYSHKKPPIQYWVNNNKFLLMFCVIFFHFNFPVREITPFTVVYGNHLVLKSIATWPILITMPGFTLLSGYFAKADLGLSSIKKYVRYLLFPYLLWCIASNMLVGHHIKDLFVYPADASWFLLSLLSWNIMLYFFMYLKRPLFVALLIATLVGYLDGVGGYLSLSRTFVFFPYFLFGYIIANDSKRMHFLQAIPKVVALGLLIGSFVFMYCLVSNNIDTDFFMGHLSYHLSGFPQYWFGLVRLLSYPFLVVLIFSFMALVPKNHQPYTELGANSLYPYIFNMLMVLILLSYFQFYANGVTVEKFIFTGFFALANIIIFSLPSVVNVIKSIMQPQFLDKVLWTKTDDK